MTHPMPQDEAALATRISEEVADDLMQHLETLNQALKGARIEVVVEVEIKAVSKIISKIEYGDHG